MLHIHEKGSVKETFKSLVKGRKATQKLYRSDEKQLTPKKSVRSFLSEKSRATIHQLEHEIFFVFLNKDSTKYR